MYQKGLSARLEKSPGASVGARRSVDEPKVAPGGGSAGSCAPMVGMQAPAVVVSYVVQGNSAQAPSESAPVLGVSNIASGGSAGAIPVRSVVPIASSGEDYLRGLAANARAHVTRAPEEAEVRRGHVSTVESNDGVRKGAASARMSGAVSGVSVACPVSALTGAQSALASSVLEGVSARLDKSPGASDGARRSVEEPKVAQGG